MEKTTAKTVTVKGEASRYMIKSNKYQFWYTHNEAKEYLIAECEADIKNEERHLLNLKQHLEELMKL